MVSTFLYLPLSSSTFLYLPLCFTSLFPPLYKKIINFAPSSPHYPHKPFILHGNFQSTKSENKTFHSSAAEIVRTP